MSRTEIRITGFGGQGVVLCGHIIGRACAIHAGKQATMIQSFGPEARGSHCSTTLVVSDSEVLYPYVHQTDILVALSSEGYETYRHELRDGGTLVYENSLVVPDPGQQCRSFYVPATRIAESMGRPIVLNIVMLGLFTATTDLVSRQEMTDAVLASVPRGTEQVNLEAFQRGLDFADQNFGSPRLQEVSP